MLLLTLALALVAAGCTGSSASSDSGRSSAVGVVTTGCGLADDRASGVAVVRPGLVVTVAHAVAGADTVTVVDAAGVRHEGTVVALDPASDIAVLEAPTIEVPHLEIAPTSSGETGALAVFSSDGSIVLKPATVVRRIDVTIEDIYIEETVRRAGLEVSADVVRGDSGAPLLIDGVVVGIVYGNSRARESVAFLLDHTELRRAIESAGAPVDTGRCV